MQNRNNLKFISAVCLGLLVSFTFTEVLLASNLERAKDLFNKLDSAHMDLIDGFYDKNAVFQDPIHQLKGSEAIKNYYAGLYKNVEKIHFEFGKSFESGDTVNLTWRMFLKAPALDRNELTVDGISVITFGGSEGKVVNHRDYFDMGEFVYERIPLLKSVIAYIKGRLSKNSN